MRTRHAASLRPASGYWILTGLLIGFGVLAIFSIGFPFLVVGVTLAALWPFRDRRALFWGAIAAELAFFVGYSLVAPLGCAATDGRVTCINILGIDYSGPATYDPPVLPAILTGLGLALAAGSVARARLRGKSAAPSGIRSDKGP